MSKVTPTAIVLILFVAFLLLFLFVNLKKNNRPVKIEPPYAVENLSSKIDLINTIIFEKEISKEAKFTSYLVSYKSENLKQYALMNLPNGPKPNSGWPVIIVNHGHIPPKEYSTINSYRNTSAYYANQGFLVLKPDYRGHDQSEGEADILFARSQYAVDVLNLVSVVDTIPQADPNKIFMYGHSMGGEIALEVAENTDTIKAITLWAPAVADYPQSFVFFLEKQVPRPTNYSEIESEIKSLLNTYGSHNFTSLTYLSKINIPVLVHHSTTDQTVPYSWGENLVSKLKSANKQVTFYSYPNDNHDIAKNFSTALSRDVQFFKNNFK